MSRFSLCLLATVLAVSVHAQRTCHSEEYQQQIVASQRNIGRPPEVIAGINGSVPAYSLPEQITIPVVVHIVYNNATQNISDAQVLSQIEVLNKDFQGKNQDKSKVPAYFSALACNSGIRFQLANVDPKGLETNGIVRKYTGIQNFSYDDRVKNGSIGGDDAWDPDSYLNIWVCNTVSGILGYSSAPGGPKEKDGVVLNYSVFGTLGVTGPFSLGRTAVHEIGHWLNLRHIWGDTYCGDDLVGDTPPQRSANRGCPSGERFTCGTTGHGDMYMNFMDFSDDQCLLMFTDGQKERMRSLFLPGGYRHSLLSSAGVAGNGLPKPAPVEPEPVASGLKVLLFPNPVSSTLTVQTEESLNCIGKTVSIYNHLGQVVASTTVKSASQLINVSALKQGLYYVRIDGVRTTGMAKFVKQ